jgi:hypothetical protein
MNQVRFFFRETATSGPEQSGSFVAANVGSGTRARETFVSGFRKSERIRPRETRMSRLTGMANFALSTSGVPDFLCGHHPNKTERS